MSFKVGLVTEEREEKDTLILDTCNIISVFYLLLHKEIQRKEGHSGKSECLPFKASKTSESLVWVSFRMGFATEKGRKGRPNHFKSLGRPSSNMI